MFSSLLSFALVSLALPLGAVASSHGAAHHRRHEAIAAHVNNTLNSTEAHLQRRGQTFTNARLTYYEVGMGACGQKNVPSDFIVALNSASYGQGYPGPNCFRPIEITYNGKTAQAIVMDECPGCPGPGGLDLSEGLFQYFAPLSEGVLYASWRYTDEGDDPAPSSSSSKWEPPSTTWQPPPTTSSTHHQTTTSTWSPAPSPTSWSSSSKEHSSTSTWTPSSSKTSSSATPSTSSHSSTHSSSTSSSAPAASSTAVGPDTLLKLNQAVLGLTEIMLAGAQANAGADVN
ncbi:RlpA-like double-psi beta-barrel-protein domain-containing protein-containing protein [Trametes punicea]|nr:RlpA-like double-psi beta-barrel-protein domain-containing protein-containing protein [Trametes punicea]